ncbi:hypothetical protein PMN51_16600 [Blautia wexlerae]|nr:hypothetical protein [Blautia wexlerae]
MAKTKEPKALKKGKASFNLIGRVKRTDKSFNLNNTYDSGWTDNSMYIGVDCGNGNVVYSEMRSGFFPDNESTIRAYSKDDKDENGKSKSVEIAWEDRLDESILDTVADTSLITVGVEKDVHGKTVYKKFLQAYDAVEYLDEYLEDNVVVNVKGNLGYSEYDGNVSVKKDITSIVLSKVEDENDFKATFSQTILIEPKCIGKTLEEKGTIELDAYVVDYVGKPKVDGKKVEVKKNVVFPKTFEIEVNENPEITAKMIKRFFDPKKKGQVNEITVAGKLVEGGSTVTITKDDIPDDIKELIEMGVYSEDEAVKKIVVGGNGNRERRMIVVKPDIVYVGQGDDRKPTVAFEEGKYEEDDLIFYEQALLAAGEDSGDTDSTSDSSEMTDEDDELVKMLADMA